MGKYSRFEVATPVRILQENFVPNFEATGLSVLGKYTGGMIREWSTAKTYPAKASQLLTNDADKLRYYHYSKFDNSSGTIPLEYFLVSRSLVGNNGENDKDGSQRDLKCIIKRSLKDSIGAPSLTGCVVEFDYLDVVKSDLYPMQNIFVLKRLYAAEQDPLILQSSIVTDTVVDVAMDTLGNDSFSTYSREMIDGIPLGRTKVNDLSLLTEFVETVTANLMRTNVEVELGEIDISTRF